jgi:hypothetical protein
MVNENAPVARWMKMKRDVGGEIEGGLFLFERLGWKVNLLGLGSPLLNMGHVTAQ